MEVDNAGGRSLKMFEWLLFIFRHLYVNFRISPSLSFQRKTKRHVFLLLFCFDPCALDLTQLRDWEVLPITMAAHINHEILIIIYNYILFDYV